LLQSRGPGDSETPNSKTDSEFLEDVCRQRVYEDDGEMCRLKQADNLETGMSALSR